MFGWLLGQKVAPGGVVLRQTLHSRFLGLSALIFRASSSDSYSSKSLRRMPPILTW